MKNLIYAIRFLLRSKAYTIINLLGLAFSLACCIILMRYIHREVNVDTHCVDKDQTVVITQTLHTLSGTPTLIDLNKLSMMHREEEIIRPDEIIQRCSFITLQVDNLVHNEQSYSAGVLVADSTFFHFFDYQPMEGAARLSAPDDAILTRRFAQRIFGKRSPIGENFILNDKMVTVRGVIDEPTDKSSLDFDVLLSIHLNNGEIGWKIGFYEFLHLAPHFDIDAFNAKHRSIVDGEIEESYQLVSLRKAYEQPHPFTADLFRHTNLTYIYLLSGVTLLLLLVGILNFVNIYMVLTMTRSKEYGIKKVFGLQGFPLYVQIWLENLLLVIPALLVAWLLIEITQIPVNRLFQEEIGYTWFDLWLSLGFIALMPLLTSVYPYIRYNYRTAITSMRSIGTNRQSVRVRMVFLFVQYILTIGIIIVSLYFGKHLHFLQSTPPGFRTEHILTANLYKESKIASGLTMNDVRAQRARRMQVYQKLGECPYIENYIFGAQLFNDKLNKFVNDKGQEVFCIEIHASAKFFDIYDIPVVEGKIPERKEDDLYTRRIVMNRAAMKAFGFNSLEEAFLIIDAAIVTHEGAIEQLNSKVPVAAVVEDFYNGHLTDGVKPIVFNLIKDNILGEVSMLVRPGQEKACIDYLKKIVKEVYNTDDFEYSWLKDDVQKLYEEDRQVSIIYSVFALIAIAVSCLGLFGISLFDIRQRYREIALRKVHGASMKDLYQLLFKKYLAVLGASFVVAVPIAYYLIHQYTADFVVKAPIGMGIFVLALLLVAVISIGTLYWQIHKAANINPAIVMKSE